MFAPKWKKEAILLAKAARKFVHYKRDLLKPEQVGEIESRRADVMTAAKAGDRPRTEEALKQLRATCEGALPYEKPVGWLEENIEVMFVAIVIALGLRAYYLQPFRIPTGSMQPTLNGIVGTPLPREEWPSLPVRAVEWLLRGRSYEHVVNKQDRHVAFQQQGAPNGVRDIPFMHFFSRSELLFHDSKPLRLPAPTTSSFSIGLQSALQEASRNGGLLKAGQVLLEGYVDAGDLVLVDKFSYHFRKPKRGEVFVFDTLGIRGIHENSGPQGGGSHYIKRLCGVPGDTLSIQSPNLIVNGKIAGEPGIRKVAEGAPPFPPEHDGYVLAFAPGGRMHRLSRPEDTLTLTAHARPGLREYAALGDNTGNSLDSRYWGTVKEFNLVGPACFALWPFTSGHWGFIR
jgi:signal peptidase I